VSRSDSSDAEGTDEREYIARVQAIGWMRNYPDGNFYPHDTVKRSHLAIILYRVSKTLPFFPEKAASGIEVSDVPFADYLYPSVAFVVVHGFLRLQEGVFGKEEPVTGYEAARALSSFRTLLKK
jgi:hypothetical protein